MGSIVLTYLVVLIVARTYTWQAGIRDRDFRYENTISMWQPDPVIGFTNQRNFSDYCFGTVHVSTDEHGFRGDDRIPQTRAPAETRIIGLGDSVMWGTCVNESDSFLGRLRTKLQANSRQVEVINAGVVGYSTLQEYLLLKNHLLQFSPDIVFVNFCENDLLPTEDPFNRVRSVYINYLLQCLDDPELQWTANEQNALRELIWVFESPAPVHMTMTRTSIACRIMATRVFLNIPIERMAQLAEANEIRLIYLLIPPRDESLAYTHLSGTVKQVLDASQVTYLDLGPALKENRASIDESAAAAEPAGWLRGLADGLVPDVLAAIKLRQINSVQDKQNYICLLYTSDAADDFAVV